MTAHNHAEHDATDIRAQLEEEREIIQSATEGPWAFEPESVGPNGEWYRPARAYVEIESHGPDGVEGDELTLGGGSPEDATFITHARTALPVRNAQIEAVLELHEFDSEDVACGNPRHTNFDVGCPDCYHPCQGCGEPYPCATVKAIQGASHVG